MRNLLEIINQQIENLWERSGAWPDFVMVMRQSMFWGKRAEPLEQSSWRWGLLPCLCCQAAGGDPACAIDLAAAWLLFYKGADIMDSVQDQDKPEPWWEDTGPGAALNVASGLFFTASLALNELHRQADMRAAAVEVCEAFHNGFLAMCSGQHCDLLSDRPGLEEWWKIARAKSGSFFGLACRGGARLAISEPERLEAFAQFGQHLGVLIQILDDLEDLKALLDSPASWPAAGNFRSLPLVYALEVNPPAERIRLMECLERAREVSAAAGEAIHILNASSAVLYLRAEIERERGRARAALAAARPEPEAGETLSLLLTQLGGD